MKANSDKCQILLSCNEPSTLMIDGSSIAANTKEVPLRISIDIDLKLDDHVIISLCRLARQKLNALARLAPYMNIEKRIIMNAFIESQFGYSPLIEMFHSWGINNKINQIHERVLRIIYKNKLSSIPDSLDKDNSVTIHHRNIRILVTETFKVLHGLSPPLINYVFMERNCNYDLQGGNFLNRRRVNSVRFGTESVFFSSKNMTHLPKGNKEF